MLVVLLLLEVDGEALAELFWDRERERERDLDLLGFKLTPTGLNLS